MKYIVLKPLVSDGVELKSGDVVDASDWRNVKSLVALRYITPVPEASETKPAAAPKKPAAPRKATSAK